jgi:hypothetical protein
MARPAGRGGDQRGVLGVWISGTGEKSWCMDVEQLSFLREGEGRIGAD